MLSSARERPGGRATQRSHERSELNEAVAEGMAAAVPDELPEGIIVPAGDRLQRQAEYCAELLKSAVLTMTAWPDAEQRYLAGLRSSMPELMMTPGERQNAFGVDAVLEAIAEAELAQSARANRYNPSAVEISRCLDVLRWLNWLSRQRNGKRDVALIKGWIYGRPAWQMAEWVQRTHGGRRKSEHTIRRWRKTAFLALAAHFGKEVAELAPTLDNFSG